MTYYYYRIFNPATTRFENRNLQLVSDPEDWEMLTKQDVPCSIPTCYFLDANGNPELWPPDNGSGRLIKVEQP